ncbi:MAG TPA: hypothetical protein VLD38_07390 [Nitrosopumilaceae archaeon]|nr:hypothetical protein [Nitrosopumilaceae archaeon]
MQNQALKLVFSQRQYLLLSIGVFVGLLLILSIISQYLFLQPIIILYISDDDIVGFVLVVIVSALSSLVVSMSIFRVKTLRAKQISGSFVGPIIGASAGVCSCGSIGFAIVTTFGTIGSTATAFLTNYEIPLRLVAIGFLAYTYFATARGITAQCKIQK